MAKISGNSYLKKENDKILIDFLSIQDFLKLANPPLMIFLENRIRDNIRSFHEIFSSTFNNFQCFYSYKANFLPEICKIVYSEGIGAEIVGLPELNVALKIGVPPHKIIVGGPYLPIELIKKCIDLQVKEVIVYNLNDLKKINELAQKSDRIQDICIRINSQKHDSKLGIVLNEKNLKVLSSLIKTCKNINITTILSHYSTQMNNNDLFKKNIDSIAFNLKNLSKYDINIQNINLGGGFPEAAVMPHKQLKNLADNLKKIINDSGITYKNIYLEPGRYFVGDSGIFVTKIVNVSEDRWIFLDIGNHICPKFAKCSLRFYNISQINEPHKFKTSIAGILPTDQDVLTKDYFFTEKLREEDLVLVSNVGAYSLTFSNRFPYPLPTIFLVKNADLKTIFDPSKEKDFSIS